MCIYVPRNTRKRRARRTQKWLLLFMLTERIRGPHSIQFDGHSRRCGKKWAENDFLWSFLSTRKSRSGARYHRSRHYTTLKLQGGWTRRGWAASFTNLNFPLRNFFNFSSSFPKKNWNSTKMYEISMRMARVGIRIGKFIVYKLFGLREKFFIVA